MAFFFFTLIFGGTLGYVGASRYFGGRRLTLFGLVLLAAIVPAATFVIGAAMTSSGMAATAYATLAIIVLVAAIRLIKTVAQDPTPRGPASIAEKRASPAPIDRRAVSPVLVGAICLAITTIFVMPLDASHIAANIGFDMHMASFMVGPATYSFAENLLPGIDYFTQYSVGTPWLFSFFLAPTASETMVNAVWFIIAEILFFQLTLLFFLRWFLRSWGWALVVGLACLVLQFTTESPLYAPSSTSARYPLLIVCVALFVYWVRRNFHWRATLALAIALSGSLFLNTETGIYTCAAVAIGAVLVGPNFFTSTARTITLGATTLVLFIIWNLVAFGPSVLQIRYFMLLLEPLMLYSGGLGAWPIEWVSGYQWFYNIISPGVALASVGWAAASARLSTPPCPRTHLAALAMIGLVGLFLTAKFINMSVVALWQVNAVGLIIVIAWWMRALLEGLPDRRTKRARLAFAVGPGVGIFRRGLLNAAATFGLDPDIMGRWGLSVCFSRG